MELHEALAAVGRGTLEPVYVIVGEERFLADRLTTAIRRRALEGGVEGFNEDVLHGKGLAGATLAAAARTVPMMADRRFVLVRDAEDMAAAEHEAVANYLEDPCPSTVLVLLAEKLDGRGRLAKAAKKREVWLDAAPLKPQAARSFAVGEAKARGHRLTPEAAEALVDAVGTDLAAMDDALERLSLYVGEGAAVELDAVEACVTRVRTESVWLLVDAVSSRNARTAIEAAGSLLSDREPPLKILALVARQFRLLAKMREALAGGASPPDAAKVAGVPPFKAREMADAAKRFKFKDLERAFAILSRTDLALKGSKRPGDLVLEEALLHLCQPN